MLCFVISFCSRTDLFNRSNSCEMFIQQFIMKLETLTFCNI